MHAKPFGIVEVLAKIAEPQVPEPEILPKDALVLDLPTPPSVNRTSGDRLGNEHPKVRQWRRSADAHLLYTRQSNRLRLIGGLVTIDIWWDIQMVGDIDNRIKHLLDYLQRLNVITNDSRCRRLLVDYGTAPDGCRVRLRPWDWP